MEESSERKKQKCYKWREREGETKGWGGGGGGEEKISTERWRLIISAAN